MPMIKNTTATGPPSTSVRRSTFLGCFGYSGEENIQLIDKVNSTSRRRRWISDWTSSCKKSTIKKVHVDLAAIPRKSKSVNEIHVVEEDATLTKKHVIIVDAKHSPATSNEIKTGRKKWTDVVKRQNGSFLIRRKETKPAEISESPEKKPVTIAHSFVLTPTPSKPLTHSKSLPVPKKQKPTKAPPVAGGVDEGVVKKTTKVGGGFDSIIAMLILLAIMVIMVLWGKLCAIFCTCAWFSFAPRLVAVKERSVMATTERRLPESRSSLNLESVEYKKKVVLEGLLQRNHRNVVGRL